MKLLARNALNGLGIGAERAHAAVELAVFYFQGVNVALLLLILLLGAAQGEIAAGAEDRLLHDPRHGQRESGEPQGVKQLRLPREVKLFTAEAHKMSDATLCRGAGGGQGIRAGVSVW